MSQRLNISNANPSTEHSFTSANLNFLPRAPALTVRAEKNGADFKSIGVKWSETVKTEGKTCREVCRNAAKASRCWLRS